MEFEFTKENEILVDYFKPFSQVEGIQGEMVRFFWRDNLKLIQVELLVLFYVCFQKVLSFHALLVFHSLQKYSKFYFG